MHYTIRLDDPSFCFTAVHAIRFLSGESEEPHRHTFRVVLKIAGPLNEAAYVVDFLEASHILRRTLTRYQGREFLPEETYNPTAETLAVDILERFHVDAIRSNLFACPPEQYTLTFELEEKPGMWAVASKAAVQPT